MSISKHFLYFFFSNKGYRFMVFHNNTSQPPQASFFESPLYERSYEGHKICMRFRYLIYGPGRHVLRIYQQLDLTDYPRRLMWAVNESKNTDLIWKYGRVALPSVTKYKVIKNKSPQNHFSIYVLFSNNEPLSLGIWPFFFLLIMRTYAVHTYIHRLAYIHLFCSLKKGFSAPLLLVSSNPQLNKV